MKKGDKVKTHNFPEREPVRGIPIELPQKAPVTQPEKVSVPAPQEQPRRSNNG